MSARDRRLREAAAERDRQASDDTQESASFIADRLSGGGDSGGSSGGGGGGSSRPSPEPEPEPEEDDEQSIAEQIGDLEEGEVLRAGGSGGEGEPDVEVISEEESRQRVRDAQIIARTDLTREELEGRRDFQRQQTEFELLGRIESQLEDRFGDIDFSAEDVRITEEDGRLRGELTDRFVEEDLSGQLGLGAEADIDTSGAFLGPEGRPGDVGGRDTDQTPGERLRDFEAGLEAADRALAEGGESFFGRGAALAESRPELEGTGAGTVIRRAGAGITQIPRIPIGIGLTPFAVGRAVSPAGIEERVQRAEDIGSVDVPRRQHEELVSPP
ncbi:MAG: hypothetical protein RI544_05895, partial [Haloquadratum sp.]|nr:hypothetical protein [Haloquadratum sp.]